MNKDPDNREEIEDREKIEDVEGLNDLDNEEYENPTKALLADLMDCFMDASEDDDSDLILLQEAVVHFAAIATHIHLYQLVRVAREQNQDVQEVAIIWLEDNIKAITESLTRQDLLRATGILLGEPQLNLRFDRKVRRRLKGI